MILSDAFFGGGLSTWIHEIQFNSIVVINHTVCTIISLLLQWVYFVASQLARVALQRMTTCFIWSWPAAGHGMLHYDLSSTALSKQWHNGDWPRQFGLPYINHNPYLGGVSKQRLSMQADLPEVSQRLAKPGRAIHRNKRLFTNGKVNRQNPSSEVFCIQNCFSDHITWSMWHLGNAARNVEKPLDTFQMQCLRSICHLSLCRSRQTTLLCKSGKCCPSPALWASEGWDDWAPC